MQKEHLAELQRSEHYEGHEFLSSQRLSNFVFNFEDAVRRALAEAADIRLTAAEQQRAHQQRQAHDRKFADDLQAQLHIEAQKALVLEAQVHELLAARDEAHLLQVYTIIHCAAHVDMAVRNAPAQVQLMQTMADAKARIADDSHTFDKARSPT